ncbi:hypothetical protein MNAN1_002655 [Malassezia nana]|uniref:Trafficking protein particle complex subunit 6B n=1 Tax=Malassezia nana TaxID=180528 RepID=A0AAF0J371_9BASI|nr:hypothetical protein MNAN1_002655 [Malassezia nana]
MEYTVPDVSTASAAPLVTPAAREWSEKASSMVDHTCCGLLFTEMAYALRTSTAYKTRRANDMVAELQHQDPGAHVPPLLTASDQADMARSRMEELGRHVGANLTEKLAQKRPRMDGTLERVKFVCKDLWSAVWDKQIDNLRTNHRQLAFAAGLIGGALERLGVQTVVQADADAFPTCAFHLRIA